MAKRVKTAEEQAERKAMFIYNYDKSTGEYLNQTKATWDDNEKDYQIPANATKIKPPVLREDFTRVFRNGWRYVKNYQGQKFYRKTDAVMIVNKIPDAPDSKFFTAQIPEGDVIWSFSSERWVKRYPLWLKPVEPFVRFWKSIRYMSDAYDTDKAHKTVIGL